MGFAHHLTRKLYRFDRRLWRDAGKAARDVLDAVSVGKQLKDIAYSHTRPFNDWLTAADRGIGLNVLSQFLGFNLPARFDS
jgi:hypothetical protein